MGNYYSLYSKNLGLSGKMVWWSTEPNWSTKLGDLTGCLILTLVQTAIVVQLFHWSKIAKEDFNQPIRTSYKLNYSYVQQKIFQNCNKGYFDH